MREHVNICDEDARGLSEWGPGVKINILLYQSQSGSVVQNFLNSSFFSLFTHGNWQLATPNVCIKTIAI